MLSFEEIVKYLFTIPDVTVITTALPRSHFGHAEAKGLSTQQP